MAAASPAGSVQLVGVCLGAALQYVGLVADLELLWLCLLAMVAPSRLARTPQCTTTNTVRDWQTHTQHATKDSGTRTGVLPKSICGGFPLLMLSSNSSTMSWVISTCMACTGGGLSPMSPVWAPTRAMPPAGSTIVVVMAGGVGVSSVGGGGRGLELAPGDVVKGSNAWREHPGADRRASNQSGREVAARH